MFSLFNAAQPGVGRAQALGSNKLQSERIHVSLYAHGLRITGKGTVFGQNMVQELWGSLVGRGASPRLVGISRGPTIRRHGESPTWGSPALAATMKQHRKFAYVVYFKIAFFMQNLEPGLNMGTWLI